MYRELKCLNCQRVLGEALGKYQIKIRCRRCKHLNHFQAA